jgi:AcrR family transcriptional regulator
MRTSPRSQPAKPPLSREAVLEAGLRVLRSHGIDGVTMRAVAAELDTGPASLYVYVENRQDLLNQMFDLVAGEVEPGAEPDPERWREQVEALLTRVLEVMNRYPGIARVPLANVPTGPRAAAIADHLIALLQAGGIDQRSIAWFIDIAFLFVNATAYETSIYVEEGREVDEVVTDIRDSLTSLESGRHPHLVSLANLLTTGSGEDRFNFGLRLLIEGLLHAAPPEVDQPG